MFCFHENIQQIASGQARESNLGVNFTPMRSETKIFTTKLNGRAIFISLSYRCDIFAQA